MSANPVSAPYTVGPDEKAASIMAYTAMGIIMGEVVVKSKSVSAPGFVPMPLRMTCASIMLRS